MTLDLNRTSLDFLHPREHIARQIEERSPDELTQLERADLFVAIYNLSPDELHGLLEHLRLSYRAGNGGEWTRPQWDFLDTLSRALDDAWIDAGCRANPDHATLKQRGPKA